LQKAKWVSAAYMRLSIRRPSSARSDIRLPEEYFIQNEYPGGSIYYKLFEYAVQIDVIENLLLNVPVGYELFVFEPMGYLELRLLRRT
jgi:hypothetical protein